MLKNLLPPELPETPTLRAWREHALSGLLRIIIALTFVPLVVDTVGSYQRGQIEHVVFNVVFYATLVSFIFLRSVSVQARVIVIIGIWLGFNGYILMYLGLVSSGRDNLFAIVILAALLLGRRQALVVWALVAVAVGVGLMIFSRQSADGVAYAAARMTDPNTLLTQGLLMIGISGVMAAMTHKLQSSFSQSLLAAEEALAERDQLNAVLEQRVAERTAQLEQVLASLHTSEVKYRTLFQAMPTGVTIIDDHGQILEHNLVAGGIGDLLGQTSSAGQLICSDGTPMARREHPGMRAIRERRAIRDIELGLRRQDGPTSWYALTAVPLDLPGYGAMIVYNEITAGKAVDAMLKQQIQMQAAIVRSSQLLLDPALTEDAQLHLLTTAMETLYAAINANPIYLLRNIDDPQNGLSARVVIHVGPTERPPLRGQQIPWENLPVGVRHSLESGNLWIGPIQGMLPPLPWLRQIFSEQDIHSILCFPIFVDQVWWGAIFFADPQPDRVWSVHETLLLRTIAGIIGPTLQRWQTEVNLSQQLRYAETLARCSQLLLNQRELPKTHDLLMQTVLDSLREAVAASHMVLYQGNKPQAGLPYTIIGTALAPGMSPPILPNPEQISDIPPDIADLLASGQVFNGPVSGRFPASQRFAEALALNQIKSALMISLFLNGKPWGMIEATDSRTARTWDASSVQLLRTAAEMLATAQQGWEASRALAASEAQLRALRDALPDLLFVVRADGTVLDYHVPPQMPLLIPPEAFLGQSITTLLPANLIPDSIIGQVQAAMSQVLTAGGVATFEYQLGLGAEQRAYEVRVVPVVADTLLFVVHDVTERQQATDALLRAKEAAESADRAKSTFLAHMSHEIRTPLTAIIGMASLLAESPLSSAQRESAAIIRTGGETLLSLIGNILDFSKIEAGQFDIVAQPFDLHVICQAAINLVSHTAARKGLELTFQIRPDMPAMVIGDGGRLRQVLVNLLSNAVKFTQRGGVWLILNSRQIDAERYEIQMIVRDTGIGIAPEQLELIFKPFVQIDHLLTRQENGTGLGLTISQHLAKLMGGRLAVESALGFGTTFTLTIPVAVAAELPASQEVTMARKPIGALRVLIAEDNLINQEVLERMLEQLGVTPVLVGDGDAAVAAVRAEPFDLVLMDIQMPIMDGETATRRIRCLGADIVQPHIIALTASALRGDRERYLEAGMNDYLSKPVQLEDLQRVLVPRTHAAAPAPLEVDTTELLNWTAIMHLLSSFQMPPAEATALIINLYEREILAQIAAVTSAAQADDRPLVARLSHKLRGGSQQLGATALAAVCARLEAAAKHPDSPALDGEIAQLHTLYDRTWALLQERIHVLD